MIRAAEWAAESGHWRPAGAPEAPLATDLPIWEQDVLKPDAGAAKTFLVLGLKPFWEYYRAQKPQYRCWYELVRSDTPCKFYIDLDMPRCHDDEQRGRDMDAVVDAVDARVREGLAKYFGSVGDVELAHLVSDGPTKASRHLIYTLGGGSVAFANCQEAGRFFGHLFPMHFHLKRTKERNADTENPLLMCHKPNGNQEHVCDSAVYNPNRCFRLVLSHKYGKEKVLQLRGVAEDELTYEHFLDTLITSHRAPVTRLLRIGPPPRRLPRQVRDPVRLKPLEDVRDNAPPGAAALDPWYQATRPNVDS